MFKYIALIGVLFTIGCSSAPSKYCDIPGMIFDPNSGPNDYCVTPQSPQCHNYELL